MLSSNSSKKRMKKFDYSTVSQKKGICSFIFWKNRRLERNITTLSDLYFSICVASATSITDHCACFRNSTLQSGVGYITDIVPSMQQGPFLIMWSKLQWVCYNISACSMLDLITYIPTYLFDIWSFACLKFVLLCMSVLQYVGAPLL